MYSQGVPMSHSTNLPLPAGTRLNRYQIKKNLAAGGFGVVYTGVRDDGKTVAIKEFLPLVIECRTQPKQHHITIKDPLAQNRFDQGLQAFFREADMLSRIHDERVIAIWDVFEHHGTAYFAMPLEKGHTLHALVRQDRWISDAAVRRLFVEAARGVEVLHAAGLLHLDLKPGNLWVRPDGTVVVLDLGASRWSDEEGRNSSMARTPGFAAPEQHGRLRPRLVNGQAVIQAAPVTDERTDVYGLAASLRAVLEGQSPPPAPDRDAHERVARRWQGQRDPGLLAVVDRAMSLKPSARYPTVLAFRQALQALTRLSDGMPRHDGLTSVA